MSKPILGFSKIFNIFRVIENTTTNEIWAVKFKNLIWMHFSVWKGHLKQNYLWIFCVLIIMCYIFLIGNWFSNWCILNLTSKPWGYKMWENIAAVWWKSFINQDIFSVPELLFVFMKGEISNNGSQLWF